MNGCSANRIWQQKIEIVNGYVSLTLSHPDGRGGVHWIDIEFLEEVEAHLWSESREYSQTRVGENQLHLHWLPLGKPPKGRVIDHIDKNKRNSLKSNLRIVTYRSNGCNMKTHGECGPGIKYEFDRNRWKVYVSMMGRHRIYNPAFRDSDQAIACRDAYLLIAHQVDRKERALPSKEELKAIADACRRIK